MDNTITNDSGTSRKITSANYPGTVNIEYIPEANYAMIHNHIPVLGYIEISNESEVDWNDLLIEISGEHISTSKLAIPFLEKGVQIQVKDLKIVPDASYLVNLTEAIGTAFNVSIAVGDEVIFNESYDLTLKAFNQWGGVNLRPEVLSAFVTPNHPLISKVLEQAAHELKDITGNSALDGYLTQDFDRARSIVAAIYRALKKEKLIYAVPPASFGKSGQRVRLSDEVVTSKVGTCLDLTLLMASCIEAAGMNPIIVVFRNHALLGVWLGEEMSPNMIMDDQSFLTKATAPGISRMVLVESTCLTDDSTFENAAELAEATVRDSETEDGRIIFDMYIDVARCRLEHILPLPQRVLSENGWNIVNEGEEHEKDNSELVHAVTYDDPEQVNKTLTKQDIWERKLLDMTMNNRLLKMVPGARLTQFWSFGIDNIENILRAGSEMKMIGCLESVNKPGIKDSQAEVSNYKDAVLKEVEGKRLISYLNEKELESTLKSISRLARNSIEENGANSLFLALGALRFYEDDISQKPCYAPLILLPVSLVRKGGYMSYVIRVRDEETMFNTTLREYLRQTFKIDIKGIDPLPTDESGVDVRQILSMVRKSIADQPRWNVLDECFLGIFSFSKFVMWNDIHHNADKLRENKVVSSLLNGTLEWADESEGVDAREADRHKMPSDFALPVDVDSSQLEAVIESGEGKSFILHGPPGTGKSQTITNIIANALYHGKRVLFVSEKMAALEVVQSRLEKIGIGPFCLELHSNTATKAHVLKQFDEALNVKHIVPAEGFDKTSSTLFERRKELVSYIDAMHSRGTSGLSVYDCITRYLSISEDESKIPISIKGNISEQAINETSEEIEGLGTVLSIIGNPKNNPLSGLDITDCSSEVRSSLENAFNILPGKIDAVLGAITTFEQAVGAKVEDSIEGYKRLMEDSSMAEEYHTLKQSLSNKYSDSFFSENPTRLKGEWEFICKEGFIKRFLDTRKFVSKLKAYDFTISKAGIGRLISDLENFQAKDSSVPDSIKKLNLGDAKRCKEAVESLLSVVEDFQKVASFNLSAVPFSSTMKSSTDKWSTGLDGLKNWSLWCNKTRPVRKKGLGLFIDKISDMTVSPKEAADIFRKSVYKALATTGINDSPSLRSFNSMLFEEVIEKYRKLSAEFTEMTRHELFHRLASNVPYKMNEIVGSSEIGILKRNISSGGRGTSIRKLMDMIPTLLPKLCPCMLMSPISVAQYISLDSPKFDLVIFDEASQMPTSEAVGAIARGKSLIVVGDPKQMPPTDFFQKTAVSEEESYIDDMESILDDCISLSIPSRYLTWHYRSRHESLIAFSNSQYYEGKLFTFPSADDRKSKVTLVPVEGVYQKGGTNKAEAKAIVDEVVSLLNNPTSSKRSIGIVSFNKKQQVLIEDMLMDVLDADKDLKKKALECEEPIFVKNLENVQGDERDIIIFSVGFGPDASGHVSMNFGPLNQHGGQRRLNVAVSRARYEMKVFSMLRGKDIDLRRTQAQGVVGLKNFLEYAENGSALAGKSQTEKSYDNAITNQIAQRLREKGLEVDTRIGKSNFRIDIGIADKNDPSRYILGILCDGESYYGTKTERDREIVQPSVLKRLGWNIMKVWTMDWFEDSDKILYEILKKVEILQNHPKVQEKEGSNSKPEIAHFNAAVVAEQRVKVDSDKEEYKAVDIAKETPTTAEHAFVDCRKKSIQIIKRLVKAESPVNSTLLYRRLRETWGITRMTPQAKEKVDALLSECGLFQSEELDGFVLWNSSEEKDSFSKYRVGEGRNDVNEIPIVELSIAMKKIVEEQIGISRDDLFHFTALRFGISRAGSNVDLRCSNALEQLKKDGIVKELEGKITIGN